MAYARKVEGDMYESANSRVRCHPMLSCSVYFYLDPVVTGRKRNESTDRTPKLRKQVFRGCWMGSRNEPVEGCCLGVPGVEVCCA